MDELSFRRDTVTLSGLGINVNNPAYGRWVHTKDHEVWHSGDPAGQGGEFHQFWLDFFELEGDAIGGRYTIQQILDKLVECRQQFTLTITE